MITLSFGNKKVTGSQIRGIRLIHNSKCYFWQGIPGCSKHRVMEHCRDEALMISTIPAFSHALTASNAAECLCKCAD